jgi:RNA polymerase sigma-70 factor (ECF subfamily)
MQESDSAAIGRALSGDPDGFRVLVERYSHAVFRLAYHMTGNESDAEDVVQEAFLRAYRKLKSFEQQASFSTWLYRIASNYSLDLLTSKRRAVEVQPPEVEDGDRRVWETEGREVDPERLALSGEIGQRLQAAFALLTPRERAAFTLRHFEDMSIAEIGSTLGLATSATKHSIFRAVQKLRRALAPLVEARA